MKIYFMMNPMKLSVVNVDIYVYRLNVELQLVLNGGSRNMLRFQII